MTIVPVIENFMSNYNWWIPFVVSMIVSMIFTPFIIKLNKWIKLLR